MNERDILRQYNYWGDEPINTGYWRQSYLERLTGYLDNRLVKVLQGQRRAGKSYLMRMVIRNLVENKKIPRKNIVYVNKDIAALDFVYDSQTLLELLDKYRAQMKPKGKVYVLLDEVQEINGWEKAVNSLSQDYKFQYEVFITGSNANLLSTELATYLTGRYICVEVFPFSYGEYIDYLEIPRGKPSFMQYIKNGGIPESCRFEEAEPKRNYLLNLKDSIILKDIVRRHHVRDVNLLEKIIHFIIDSVGALFSLNSAVNTLKSKGYKTNAETLGNYINYIKESYFIHESERYDIKGKRILSGEKKYYINDLGFKFHLSSSFEFDLGKYLENAVYLDLRRKGYTVYTGKMKEKEIDFVAETGNTKKYIQVCYLLADESVVESEFGNLELIRDNYEKIVVSFDDVNLGNRAGIQHINAWEFID